MSHEVWVEKYRPRTLDEVVNQKEIVSRLKMFVQNESLPHLIFAGPAGIGKTTSAYALARDLYKNNFSSDVIKELNASDERGIDVIRTTIKNFAHQKTISGVPFKILILDESDNMTAAAQQALRRTMEKYTKNCRFILICNYSSKIIEPIQSRCAVFRFSPLTDEDIARRIKHVARNEGVKITPEGLDAILYVSEGDLRKAVNTLQAAASISEEVTADAIYKITGKAQPEEIRGMIRLALDGKFLQARKELHELLSTHGLSGIDIVKQIHREIYNLEIDEMEKIILSDKIGEINYRLIEGANEDIQLSSLLARCALLRMKDKMNLVE
ncbi:MAG: replication factor C small subunit [Candidatus Helarchaeales archaeon]